MQKVKDIFSDYSSEQGNICEADFLKANLYKKSNRLEVCLTSANKISIGEISEFEDYIVDRFKVGSARIEIQYENIDVEPTIENDWQDLVTYMSSNTNTGTGPIKDSSYYLSIVDDKYVTFKVIYKPYFKKFISEHFSKGMLVKVKGEVFPYAIEHGEIKDGVSFIGETCNLYSFPRYNVKQENKMIKESQMHDTATPNLEDYNKPDF